MMEVKVKQEYLTIDKTDFDQVCDLVDRIIEDISENTQLETNPMYQDELRIAMMKDYMIDLINPDLLDFSNED